MCFHFLRQNTNAHFVTCVGALARDAPSNPNSGVHCTPRTAHANAAGQQRWYTEAEEEPAGTAPQGVRYALQGALHATGGVVLLSSLCGTEAARRVVSA